MGELTEVENMGKNAPAPCYKYEDHIKYKEVSNGQV
jgi:hypothetical protein